MHSSTSLFVKGDIDMESSTPKCIKQVGVISPNPSLAHTVNNTEAEPETATWNPTAEEIALITVTFKKNMYTQMLYHKRLTAAHKEYKDAIDEILRTKQRYYDLLSKGRRRFPDYFGISTRHNRNST